MGAEIVDMTRPGSWRFATLTVSEHGWTLRAHINNSSDNFNVAGSDFWRNPYSHVTQPSVKDH